MTSPGFTDLIGEGLSSLGIELGSTRVKACLVGVDPSYVLATGSHEWENELVDGVWTYSLDAVAAGVRAAVADLHADVHRRHNVALRDVKAIGVSAMMHGYLAFDAGDFLLVPFRTWRNTATGQAAAELTELLQVNIPLRWSIAHYRQALLDDEPHVRQVAHLTTLAGYVHTQLTGRRVLGIGDASGMFPVDAATRNWDSQALAQFDALTGADLRSLLPDVLPAGAVGGVLTPAGAAWLDPSGFLQPGAVACPPEGDAGTGMVATNAVTPRTGNVSAGTSIFAMVVLDHPLEQVHAEIDVVATPTGAPVAMVHCNNGASELAAWAAVFQHFASTLDAPSTQDETYAALFREAQNGAPDAGGLVAYNQLAAEPMVGLSAGAPMVIRTPESSLTLANLMRAQIYGMFAPLAMGMRILDAEGISLDVMRAHGGVFRTAGVAQQFLAAALRAPVSVSSTASEGGAWGMAVLAAYTVSGAALPLDRYLAHTVFATDEARVVRPSREDLAGFAVYLARYADTLAAVQTAADVFAHEGASR